MNLFTQGQCNSKYTTVFNSHLQYGMDEHGCGKKWASSPLLVNCETLQEGRCNAWNSGHFRHQEDTRNFFKQRPFLSSQFHAMASWTEGRTWKAKGERTNSSTVANQTAHSTELLGEFSRRQRRFDSRLSHLARFYNIIILSTHILLNTSYTSN